LNEHGESSEFVRIKKQPVMMLMVIDCGDATSFCHEI